MRFLWLLLVSFLLLLCLVLVDKATEEAFIVDSKFRCRFWFPLPFEHVTLFVALLLFFFPDFVGPVTDVAVPVVALG